MARGSCQPGPSPVRSSDLKRSLDPKLFDPSRSRSIYEVSARSAELSRQLLILTSRDRTPGYSTFLQLGSFYNHRAHFSPAVQVVGLLNQTGINLNETDFGGELDPHGVGLYRPAYRSTPV